MAEYRISHFMIALTIIGMVMFGFMNFMTIANQNYNSSLSIDPTSTLSKYDPTVNITTITKKVDDTTTTNTSGNVLSNWVTDITGKIFGDAYQAYKITKDSYKQFDSMVDQVSKDKVLGISPYIKYIKAIVMIIILLAIILGVLLGRQV